MANVGDIQKQYGRLYAFVNPDPAKGPGVWRLASDNSLGVDGGGGGGNTIAYEFEGEAPINVDVLPSQTGGPTEVATSMDITQLEDRAK